MKGSCIIIDWIIIKCCPCTTFRLRRTPNYNRFSDVETLEMEYMRPHRNVETKNYERSNVAINEHVAVLDMGELTEQDRIRFKYRPVPPTQPDNSDAAGACGYQTTDDKIKAKKKQRKCT